MATFCGPGSTSWLKNCDLRGCQANQTIRATAMIAAALARMATLPAREE